jgi:hypothetical protein
VAVGLDISASGPATSSSSATGAIKFGPVIITQAAAGGALVLSAIVFAVWWIFFRKK